MGDCHISSRGNGSRMNERNAYYAPRKSGSKEPHGDHSVGRTRSECPQLDSRPGRSQALWPMSANEGQQRAAMR
jgi:hypothetical protein